MSERQRIDQALSRREALARRRVDEALAALRVSAWSAVERGAGDVRDRVTRHPYGSIAVVGVGTFLFARGAAYRALRPRIAAKLLRAAAFAVGILRSRSRRSPQVGAR